MLNLIANYPPGTPNHSQFQFTEPEQNVFTYAGGEEVVKLAKQHGNRFVRCHNLVWVTEVSQWVLDRNWTAAALTEVMRNHIFNVVTHFSDECYSWDVVNEALNENGTWAPSVWFDNIGEEYFFKAYQFAEEAVKKTGKNIKLYYVSLAKVTAVNGANWLSRTTTTLNFQAQRLPACTS